MPIINTNSLPLRYSYGFPTVEIKPFVYKSLMDYLEGMPSNPSDLYIYDLTWVLRDDPKCEELLLPDLEYLVFLKKAISIDGNLRLKTEIACPKCGKVNTVIISGSDFKFVRPTDEVLYDGIWMELTTGTYLCKLPTARKFFSVYELTKTYNATKHLDLIKSIAMINEQEINPMEVENSILNAGADDIATIITVYDMLYKSLLPIKVQCSNPECPNSSDKHGEMAVGISSLIANVFRTLLLSRPVNRDKIYIKQTSQHKDRE